MCSSPSKGRWLAQSSSPKQKLFPGLLVLALRRRSWRSQRKHGSVRMRLDHGGGAGRRRRCRGREGGGGGLGWEMQRKGGSQLPHPLHDGMRATVGSPSIFATRDGEPCWSPSWDTHPQTHKQRIQKTLITPLCVQSYPKRPLNLYRESIV